MAEQNTPKLVQDAAEPAPVDPPTPGLDAPMRATAERLVAEAAEAAPKAAGARRAAAAAATTAAVTTSSKTAAARLPQPLEYHG